MSFLSDLYRLGQILESHRNSTKNRSMPVIQQKPIAGIIHELDLERFPREGGLQGETLAQFLDP
jgi:hypothetical protein